MVITSENVSNAHTLLTDQILYHLQLKVTNSVSHIAPNVCITPLTVNRMSKAFG